MYRRVSVANAQHARVADNADIGRTIDRDGGGA